MGTIINFLLIAGVVQGLIFNIVTFFFGKKYGKVILFLNLTVLFISLNNLQAWLPENGYSFSPEFLQYYLVPWYSLIMPCFHYFLVHYLQVAEKYRTYVLWAVVIFAGELICRGVWILYLQQNGDVNLPMAVEQYNIYEEILNIIFSIFVFVKAVELVFFKKDELGHIQSFDDLKWIRIFLILGMIMVVFWMIALGLRMYRGFDGSYDLVRLGLSFLLYWIGYQGLYRYTVVQDRILLRRAAEGSSVSPMIASVSKNTQTNFEKYQEEFEKVHQYIRKEQRYLDPLFSLDKLAEELSLSSSHLSKVINLGSGQHFSDYINGFRVEQAKEFLSNPDFEKYTMVSIGLECGFNSRSTFYAAFKKLSGQSPATFRNSID